MELLQFAGNLPSEVPDATDDFYLNTNYEWLSEHQETAASDTLMISMTTQALTDLYSLVVTDPNDPNVSVYSAFLVSYMDTSGRDSAGTGDLMPYITGLMEADSLSDLTDYLISGDCVLTGPFVDVSVAGFDTISDENIPVVSYDPLTLSSPSLYLGDSFRYYMDPAEDHYAKLLMLIGYSQEEADAMNDAATSLEVKLASGITMSGIADVESIYVPYTTEELDAVCSSFPILEVLEAMGYPSDTYSVFDMGWLTTLDSLYTEENFEGLRAMILRNTLDHASGFMGGEFLAEYMDYNATTLEGSWNTFISTDRAIFELLNTHVLRPCGQPRGGGDGRLPVRAAEGCVRREDLRARLDVRVHQAVRAGQAGCHDRARRRTGHAGLLRPDPSVHIRREPAGRLRGDEAVLRRR